MAGQPQRLALVRHPEASETGGRVDGDQAPALRFQEELASDGHFAADAGRGAGCACFKSGNRLAGEPGAVGAEVVARDGSEAHVPGFQHGQQLGQVAGVGTAGAR